MPNSSLPVVIPESALDFVLIGPHDGMQRILVQSKNLDLLLLGMARTPSHLISPDGGVGYPSKSEKIIAGLYENDPEATLYAVTAVANVTSLPNARQEPFTFAWIGRSPRANLIPIRDYFRNCVASIHLASSNNDPLDNVRWHLAPLLLMCAKWTKTTRETDNSSVSGNGNGYPPMTALLLQRRYRAIQSYLYMASSVILIVATVFGAFLAINNR